MSKVLVEQCFDLNMFTKHCQTKAQLYKGAISNWPAVGKWSVNYFENSCPNVRVSIKYFRPGAIEIEQATMKEFANRLGLSKRNNTAVSDMPYCHDVPLFLEMKELTQDIVNFPSELLPTFYRNDWWKFAQFFVSPKGAVTPLHFDTLRTNNIFFQIKGRKRFTLISWSDRKLCERKGWRWFDIDPEDSETQQRLKNAGVNVAQVEVGAGDMFFMPAGMLHHVRSLDECISFNLDFHTKQSVARSFLGIKENMPRENIYFNWLTFKGLVLGMNRTRFFEKYRPYLNYVS
ncbi:hypothetical protein PULV_a4251 [Pseudoalteromonas ulvae UL12]|uniref:cupin-like domain-containing protein n=1 Tax=Pseudoalteromonas ulvae TaxID=107327 RepID=UPI00186B7B80|nr:cupin-like domain-containing protein [Pseudoalteromonas ulvae]MBE0361874.1 hypothetical protein [Pseudoalteromonas ulvae UL12]